MNRRQLIAAAPATLIAGSAVSGTVTPIEATYREIVRLRAIQNADGLSDDQVDAWGDKVMELADGIIDMPSQGPMDFIYKIMGYTLDGEHELDQSHLGKRLWVEARALVA
ncbi:hypothetical protein [Paracoccus saliphilus]|uniref:Tat (Twin-arginine translocation) pathway signal sequence n=1 Tax=Paracoccus saliphilus TaxID=405559 RepID=A0AA45W4N3_9RHOB|nr:hypothetical protein [Paracoccus saliphilus]WCR04571.1 hypothetical protein JHX88_07590 [Paracoccus saliphilus]SIS86932.1 hypothetical protein SAMN05421772_10727 [Paracoccus saliphilus]